MDNPEQPSSELKIVASTKYLELVEQGGWSYVRRTGKVEVVCVAALTSHDELVLVEQFRPPLGARAIELPAGLARDISGQEDESLEHAAQRELLEETGFVAEKWEQMIDVSSSSGMTSEVVTVFRASQLTRQTEGGGVPGEEDIVVHLIPKHEVVAWLLKRQKTDGVLVDGRVYTGLLLV